MGPKTRTFCKLSFFVVVFGVLFISSVLTHGQTALKQAVGLPDDWSHHHLVFSNPGTAEDAWKNGTYDQWLKIINDPRYQMQQIKRSGIQRGVAAAPNTAAETPTLSGTELAPEPITAAAAKKPKAKLTKDWSMNMGGAGASLTGMVGSLSGNISGSSALDIDGTTIDASAPTAAFGTGSFSSPATAGATLKIVNGANTLTLTAVSTANANCTGSAPTFSGSFNVGSSGTSSTYSAGIISVLGSGSACSTDIGVTASGSSPILTLTANTPGTGANSTITLTWTSTSHFSEAWNSTDIGGGTLGTTAGTNGTQSGSDFVYWSGTTYLTPTQVAANIVSTILANGTLGAAFTATSNGAVVTVADKTVGTGGNSFTATPPSFPAFTWSNSGDFSGGNAAVASDMGAGVYPTKYTFNPNATPSCTDYVAYNTGLTGSSTVPSIIAYNNIYVGATSSGGCGTTGLPTVYWEYNTGGQIVTSPVVSYDGSQLAFVQTEGGIAYLTILRYGATGATLSAPTTETAANYPGCSAPCMTSIKFDNGPADTNSSPYYNYLGDSLYVGDNSGNLHEFIHIFNGTNSNPPAEELTGWPVTVSTQTAKTLTSPVYDSASGNIFVADSGGFLYSYPPGGSVVHTSQLAVTGSTGIVDAPLVDSATSTVYVWVGDDGNTVTNHNCDNATGCNGVFRFSTSLGSTSGTGLCSSTNGTSWTSGTVCGSESVFGVGTTSTTLYDGSFDNTYYGGTGNTGNLWSCGATATPAPKLVASPMSTFSTTTISIAANIVNPLASGAATGSPVTEIYNGTTDYIFLSMTANGDQTGCTGACVYSYTIAASGTSATLSAGLAAAGGTSGIIIDNISATAGASQIYFGLLGGTQACAGNGNGPGLGSGGCAVQVAQSGL